VKRYPLILDDAKRNLSKRPLAQNDCTVRALALVTGASYDAAYDQLAAAGRKSGEGFDIGAYLKKAGVLWGYKVQKIKVPRALTLDRLMAERPDRIIIETSDHVIAVLKGRAHDMIRLPGDSRVYAVWKFRRVA